METVPTQFLRASRDKTISTFPVFSGYVFSNIGQNGLQFLLFLWMNLAICLLSIKYYAVPVTGKDVL